MPWAQSGGYDEAIAWMLEQFDRLGIAAIGSVEQVKNAYVSSVLRCPTDVGMST
jgi:hypothetical protein